MLIVTQLLKSCLEHLECLIERSSLITILCDCPIRLPLVDMVYALCTDAHVYKHVHIGRLW